MVCFFLFDFPGVEVRDNLFCNLSSLACIFPPQLITVPLYTVVSSFRLKTDVLVGD